MEQIAKNRIVFMGTPDFAVPALQRLHEQASDSAWEVVGVATQPDRPGGRGKRMIVSPVKQYAIAHNIPVIHPVSFRKDPTAVESLQVFAPDAIVVAAYGLILPKVVLELPTCGCINVHASLLPAYRGASPIVTAILDGRTESGVSIMLMDEGMDTGPVMQQAHAPIKPDDTTATLSARLADLGAELLVATLPEWFRGDVAPIAQEDLPGEPSVCRLIRKEQGAIDWTQTAAHIERMTRAYSPWPTAFTYWRGEPFKVLHAEVIPGIAAAGAVVATPAGPAVGTGAGLLLLRTVQPAGKRPMDTASFLNGAPSFMGTVLPD